ncbi:MAG: isopeptide-forming domain-containing fimbrial protein [Clostridiales bacterium]|nr:isopeptide-forming domain-containing fimbrial protein [Clostridiales bacterium]
MKQSTKRLKIAAFVLTLLLVLPFSFGISAADESDFTITITSTDTYQLDASHQFSAYQVFSGTINPTTKTLADIDWGEGINGFRLVQALKASDITVPAAAVTADGSPNGDDKTGKTTTLKELFKNIPAFVENPTTAAEKTASKAAAQAVADILKTYYNTDLAGRNELTGDSQAIQVFADIIGSAPQVLKIPTAVSSYQEGNYVITISKSKAGYYFVKETGSNIGAGQAKTRYLMRVSAPGIVTPVKTDVPTLTKKVYDGTAWNNVADYAIGENIQYSLTGTLPGDYDKYNEYTYQFKDTLPAGITYKDIASIKIYTYGDDGKGTETVYTLTEQQVTANAQIIKPADNNNVLSVDLSDLKELDTKINDFALNRYARIEIIYNAALNAKAVVGGAGNANSAVLVYSNDPNTQAVGETAQRTGTTIADKATVFTYQLDVTKKNGKSQDTMEGVTFKLGKTAATGGYVWAKGTFDQATSTLTISEWVNSIDDAIELTSGKDGHFIIKGLDQGSYCLQETKTLDGFELIKAPIPFTMTATLTGNADTEAHALTALALAAGENTDGVFSVNSDAANIVTGLVSATVFNMPGAALPRTGGMGTIIFYTAGSLLILGAVLFLFLAHTKRKANNAESK